jgi:hypothetical protein
MGAGDRPVHATPGTGRGPDEGHVVRAQERWGFAVLGIGAAFALAFAVGIAVESDAIQLMGIAGIALFYGLVRTDTRPSSVSSMAFAPSGVTAAVRGGQGTVHWDAPPVTAVAVRGQTRLGFLVPIRTFAGPVRAASVVLLDEAGRVVDAPTVSWVRVDDVRAAVERAGLRWEGRLPFHPVPSVPVPRPDDAALGVVGQLVAHDPHVDEALADHDGPSVGLRLGALAALVLVVVVASLVVQSAAVLIPGIVLVVGATVLFVVDAVLDRVKRRATQAAIEQTSEHLTWSAAECIVLDVPPSSPSQEGLVVLGPAGEVVTGLRLESAPAWLRARRRQWLLVARDASVRRGVVALPDRSRATPVDVRSFDPTLVRAWMTGEDALKSAGDRPGWPARSTEGAEPGAMGNDGADADDGGR